MMTTAASSSAIADHDCCASFAGICLFGAMPSCTDYSMAGDNIAPRKRHINRPKGANIHLLSADRDWRARAGNCSAEDFANRFTIRASVPGVEVSWKVTGIRKDADAGAHRIRVEQ